MDEVSYNEDRNEENNDYIINVEEVYENNCNTSLNHENNINILNEENNENMNNINTINNNWFNQLLKERVSKRLEKKITR